MVSRRDPTPALTERRYSTQLVGSQFTRQSVLNCHISIFCQLISVCCRNAATDLANVFQLVALWSLRPRHKDATVWDAALESGAASGLRAALV